MADTYTETSHQGFGSRIANSFKGIVVGILFFLASFAVLWWNEGNLAREKNAFREMEAAVVEGDSSQINPALNNKLVHMVAELTSPQPIGDPQFLTPGKFLVLERQVEMYQWTEDKETETKERVGGSTDTTTTYKYQKEWKRGRENSENFRHTEGHQNPAPGFNDETFRASSTGFGKFQGDDIVERLSGQDWLNVEPTMLTNSRTELRDGFIYLGRIRGSEAPEIGDLRIRYQVVRPGTFSVMAVQQSDARFGVFQSSDGKEKFLVESGNKSSVALLTSARETASMIAWLVRALGAFLMWLGLVIMLNPLATLLSILPPMGSIGRGAIALFSLILTLILSVLTILVSMIAHNPIMLAVVIVIGVGGIVWWLKKKSNSGQTVASAGVSASAATSIKPPPPPPVGAS